jgi:hypothetical protein
MKKVLLIALFVFFGLLANAQPQATTQLVFGNDTISLNPELLKNSGWELSDYYLFKVVRIDPDGQNRVVATELCVGPIYFFPDQRIRELNNRQHPSINDLAHLGGQKMEGDSIAMGPDQALVNLYCASPLSGARDNQLIARGLMQVLSSQDKDFQYGKQLFFKIERYKP